MKLPGELRGVDYVDDTVFGLGGMSVKEAIMKMAYRIADTPHSSTFYWADGTDTSMKTIRLMAMERLVEMLDPPF